MPSKAGGSRGYVEVSGTAEVPKGTNGIPEDATWTFVNKTSSIRVQKSSNQLFIQTDRPIYKPGETSELIHIVLLTHLN